MKEVFHDEKKVSGYRFPPLLKDKLASFDSTVLHWLLSFGDPEVAIGYCRWGETRVVWLTSTNAGLRKCYSKPLNVDSLKYPEMATQRCRTNTPRNVLQYHINQFLVKLSP